MEQAGLMERLFSAFQLMLAKVRGSLYYAVLFVSVIFAAATGIVGASVTILGIMAAKSMNKSNYDVKLAAGTITAGGTLGILIPPSIMLVVMGPIMEIPVTDLFAAAILPGVLLACLYAAYTTIRCMMNPKLGPPLPEELRATNMKDVWIEFFVGLVPPAALVFAALGSILFGFATPTEAAGCGAAGSLILALAYKKLTLPKLQDALVKTLEITALIMVLVGIFMFGVQTFFISKSIGYLIRIILYQVDNQILSNEYLLIFFFGLNPLDWFSLFTTFVFQFYLFTKGPEANRFFIKFSAIFVYFGLIIFFIMVVTENYSDIVKSLVLSAKITNPISKENISPIFYVAGTMFTYFSILILSYGDFSRYAKNKKEMYFGNFSLIINLLIFSFFAILLTIGSDIILTKNLISADKLLTNPNDIIAKFDNSTLTVFSLIFILFSMLSTNLIANYIPSQNALINFLPNSLSLKKAGYIIIFFGLLIGGFWLSIFSQSSVLLFFDSLTSFFGPLFGIVVADYYFIKKGKINHKELFYPIDTTEYVYSGGWNYKAIYSLIVGFIFSASTMWNVNLNHLESLGWVIGAFVAFTLYSLLNND